MLYKGSSEIQKVYLGGTPLSAIYHGVNKIYPKDQPGPGPEPPLEGIVPYGDDPENMWQLLTNKFGGSMDNPGFVGSKFATETEWLSAWRFITYDDNHSNLDTSNIVHARLNNLERIGCITVGKNDRYRGDGISWLRIGNWANSGRTFIPRFSVQFVANRYYNLYMRVFEYNSNLITQEDIDDYDYLGRHIPRTIFSYHGADGTVEDPKVFVQSSQEIWRGDQRKGSYAKLFLSEEDGGKAKLLLRTYNSSTDELYGYGGFTSETTSYEEFREMSVLWGDITVNQGAYHVRSCAFLDSNDNVIWDPLHGWQL